MKEYQYLGQIVSFENSQVKELKERRKKTWESYWALKNSYENKKMSVQAKIKVLESCSLPVLAYGVQIWLLTKTQIMELRITQRAMERSILNVKQRDRMRNNEIRKRTGVRDIGCRYIVKKLKFKYGGHIAREKKDDWVKKVTEWTPYDRIKRKGKPTIR